MVTTPQDKEYMQRALLLAKKGEGKVSPNPMVGAVIVKNGHVIAEGYHQKHGEAHAERNAIMQLAARNSNNIENCAQGATIYVSLEPCNHHGKTPPCTQIIIESGIKRVVFAMSDPNPKVKKGGSAALLRKAGIVVDWPLLAEEAAQINKSFIKNISQKIPYLILKTASSLDGKIATRTGASKWITGPESRKLVHQLRYQTDAVLVGINTVIKDNPSLAPRNKGQQKTNRKIVLDTNLQIPLTSKLLSKPLAATTIIIAADHTNETTRAEKIRERGATVLTLPVNKKSGKVPLKKAMQLLYKEFSIGSILIEGGGTINEAFLQSGLLAEYWGFFAPKFIGGATALGSVSGIGFAKLEQATTLKNLSVEKVGADILIRGLF